MNSNLNETRCSAPSLRGQTGWIITDGKAGNLAQALGVAEALGLEFVHKLVEPRGIRRFLAPWGGVGRHERFGQPGSMFASPWPAIAIATGRASIPYIMSIQRAAGAECFTVVLQDPRTGPKTADLIWVPEHDRLRGANVISTITSPHRFSPEKLAELRAILPREIAELPSPRVAVVIGGPNSAYSYPLSDLDRLTTTLDSLVALGASFMITPSRRTRRDMIEAIDKATVGAPRILWRGEGDNPYPYFLASADSFIVTADSVNMMGEACATGRPVYLFMPTGEPGKFGSFHSALEAHGATRALPERFEAIEEWTYPPLYSATQIAEEIDIRWHRRRAMLSGLMQR